MYCRFLRRLSNSEDCQQSSLIRKSFFFFFFPPSDCPRDLLFLLSSIIQFQFTLLYNNPIPLLLFTAAFSPSLTTFPFLSFRIFLCSLPSLFTFIFFGGNIPFFWMVIALFIHFIIHLFCRQE